MPSALYTGPRSYPMKNGYGGPARIFYAGSFNMVVSTGLRYAECVVTHGQPISAVDFGGDRSRVIAGFILATGAAVNLSHVSIEGNSDAGTLWAWHGPSTISLYGFSSRIPSIGNSINIRVNADWDASMSNTSVTLLTWFMSGLNHLNPIDQQSSFAAVDTTRTVNVQTRAGGLAIACANNNVFTGNTCVWTGSPVAPLIRVDSALNNIERTAADILAPQDSTAQSFTATFALASTLSTGIAAMSFR